MLNIFKRLLGLGSTSLSLEDLQTGTIIDVRTPAEFQRRHVAGSINIPLPDLSGAISELRQLNAPIVTCCASGMRSGVAAKRLKSAGIKAVNGGTWSKVNRMLNH